MPVLVNTSLGTEFIKKSTLIGEMANYLSKKKTLYNSDDKTGTAYQH